MDQTVSIHLDDDDRIECYHSRSDIEPRGYPVLSIEAWGRERGLVIFPTRGHLERLHAAVGAYLAARPAPAGPALSLVRCGCGSTFWTPGLTPLSATCRRCGRDIPDDGPRPVPAEASTDAPVLDADDLWHEMASSFEPRGEVSLDAE